LYGTAAAVLFVLMRQSNVVAGKTLSGLVSAVGAQARSH